MLLTEVRCRDRRSGLEILACSGAWVWDFLAGSVTYRGVACNCTAKRVETCLPWVAAKVLQARHSSTRATESEFRACSAMLSA